MTEVERRPWERRADETGRAYVAFCIYLNLGAGRSIDRAYRSQLPPEVDAARQSPKPPGRWREWGALHQWRDRAEAWDIEQQVVARHAKQAEHQKALQDHLERQRKLAITNVELANGMLEKARERLLTLDVSEIEAKHLPAFVRAAAAVAEAGTNAEAQAIAVDQVISSISHDESG